MIGYATLGCNNLEKGGSFYDALLGEIGGQRFMADDRLIMWGKTPGQGMLGICTPYDEKAPTVGNGVMIAINVETQENVDKFHAKALELGGSDEGAPGPRGEAGTFYGGYFRDLDGNKLVAFCM